MKIVIPRKEAIAICCRAFKDYAINRGLSPDAEIKISRWYLQMNRNNMTFFGVSNGTDKQRETESGKGSGTSDPVFKDTEVRRPRGRPRKNREDDRQEIREGE